MEKPLFFTTLQRGACKKKPRAMDRTVREAQRGPHCCWRKQIRPNKSQGNGTANGKEEREREKSWKYSSSNEFGESGHSSGNYTESAMSGVEDRRSYRESMIKHAKARLKKVQKKFGFPSVGSEPRGLNRKGFHS